MNNHKMKKKFGQNFLTDKNLLKKIVDSADIVDKDVIEIGPGQGALTNFLVLSAKTVTAYEIDFELQPYLNHIMSEHSNLNVIYQDILNIDLLLDKEHHVVANIPYNITSPIIFKILETSKIKSATLMVQKEVCDRITSNPGSREYNALSVIVQYYMDVQKIMNVNRKLFHPVPNVDSAVFRMVRKEKVLTDEQEEMFIKIVKGSFQQKRKTLLNNLHMMTDQPKKIISEWLLENNIDGEKRAESLNLADFIKMAINWEL